MGYTDYGSSLLPRRFTESFDCKKAFLHVTEQFPAYHEAVPIVKNNVEQGSSIFIAGGFVYRSIIQYMDNVPFDRILPIGVDLDFVVVSPNDEFVVPENWKLSRNYFGNPKFRKGECSIDLIILNHYFQQKRNEEPTIENYLRHVPLNVQSIAYDFQRNLIIGCEGQMAIRSKVVRVNNEESARFEAERKSITINQLVQKTADQLGFLARTD